MVAKKGQQAATATKSTATALKVLSPAEFKSRLVSLGFGPKAAESREKSLLLTASRLNVSPNSIIARFFSLPGKATKKDQDAFTKFVGMVDKYSSANFSHMFPYAIRAGPRGEVVNASMAHRLNAFKNSLRHLGTPSVHTASLGSILETLAVGYAAAVSDVPVMYWEENRYFANSQPGARPNGPKPTFCGPGREQNDVMAVMNALRTSPSHKVLLLKTIINTQPLFNVETNNARKTGWAKIFLNAATPASVNQALSQLKTMPGLQRLTRNGITWNHIKQVYSHFSPKPSEISVWKGFFEAEPDGIFFIIIDGVLYIYVLEFKITKGHAELVPSEAWQLAKTKRLLDHYFGQFSGFSGDKLVIKTIFVPWQYGQGVNSTAYNFRNPWNVIARGQPRADGVNFSALYRNTLGNSYRPDVWTPPKFETNTGINASIVESVIRSFDRSKAISAAKTLEMVIRAGRVATGRAGGGSAAVARIRPNAPGTALKNRAAAAAAAMGAAGVTENCTNGRYGTNHGAIILACGVLTPDICNEIVVNVQRLGLVHGWAAANDEGPVTQEQYQAGINAVNQICRWGAYKPPASSEFYNSRVDALRLKAFRDRLRAAGNAANAQLPEGPLKEVLLNLRWVKPSDSPIYVILQRVLANASTLEPKNVVPILNALKTAPTRGNNSNLNMYRKIFNRWMGNNRIIAPIAARTSTNNKLKRYTNNWSSRQTASAMNANAGGSSDGQYGSFVR